MSPTIAAVPTQPKGIKGKRVIGRPGRFDPTEPLHMTTRRANKKHSVSGGEPSANGSVKDFESRRPSFDAERPVTAHSNGTQASKGTYASDFSPPQPVPDIDMSEAPPISPADASMMNGERKSRSPLEYKETSPPTLKRKRSSPSPPPAPQSDGVGNSEDDRGEPPSPEDDYDSDTVQVVRQDELSDREESGDEGPETQDEDSPESSQSQEIVPPYDVMAGTSVDVTPMLSEQPSPATSGSLEEEDQDQDTAIAKPLAAALKEVADAKKQHEPIEPEQPDDQPMLDPAPGIEDADEIEEQVRTDEEGRMVVRRGRFGGRRRAQHPNPNIEVAMRRQAHLKSAYRAIARAQKSILVEVTERTVDDLEANQNLHTEVVEYEGIVQELDAALAKRKAVIQAQHEMRLKQLKITWDGEQYARVAKCRQQLEDVEETKVDRLQYEFLRIARSAQLEDGNETEDEDDVIPRLKQTAYHWKRGAGLDPAYDSRSRLAIETQRAAKDMQARYNMYEMLKELPDENKPEKRNGFTVMDERPRTAASKNREGQDNLEMLVDAGAETDRIARMTIPNEQALGLQMLGDLASRPSIVGGRPQSSGSISGQAGGAAGPPQLHLQMPSGPSPIQLQMSPRTHQAMGNRFEPNQMPPPSTPRQDAGLPANRSPEATRHERRPSTPSRDERPNGLLLRSPARPQFNEADNLHHRIASRDGLLQNSLFGSFGSPGRLTGPPGFRPADGQEGPRRRAASHSDMAPPFPIRSDPSIDPRLEEERREPRYPNVLDGFKNESPRFDPVRSQLLRWPDQHSQAGASNGRSHETASPKSEQFSLAGTPGPQNSTASGQDATTGNHRARHGSRGSKTGSFPHKTSKAERKGVPRRQFQKDKKNQQQQRQENGMSENAGTPTTGPPYYGAGSPPIGMRQPSPYNFVGPPPIRSPQEYPHPGLQHHGGFFGPPPSHGFPPHPLHHHASFDHHHRNSFPPPPPGFGWQPPQQPPQSPLYPVPPPHSSIQPPPPPPGVSLEQHLQHLHRFPPPPPPPPPGYPHPPPSPFPPRTPHPQSAPGPGYLNHTRGPSLAPAGAFAPQDGFRGSNPPPAFAQQQQQNGNNFASGNRRRAQSDVGFVKFQPGWLPKERRN